MNKSRESHSERTSIDDGGAKKKIQLLKKTQRFFSRFPIFIALIQNSPSSKTIQSNVQKMQDSTLTVVSMTYV